MRHNIIIITLVLLAVPSAQGDWLEPYRAAHPSTELKHNPLYMPAGLAERVQTELAIRLADPSAAKLPPRARVWCMPTMPDGWNDQPGAYQELVRQIILLAQQEEKSGWKLHAIQSCTNEHHATIFRFIFSKPGLLRHLVIW